MDPEINRTLSYWFEGEDVHKKWFGGGPAVDDEIRDQFGALVEKARASQLSSWAEEPKGTMALLVLLDQIPRNIFRGAYLSHSSDKMALDIATLGIAKGFDRELTRIQQVFFYLPLMHDEQLISQIAALAMYEALLARCPADATEKEFIQRAMYFSGRHRDCIMRFGRFPARNECLGRTSTPDEIQYLIEHPSGF